MDRCPYKGLLPYTEDDAPYFFGRDTERRVIGDNLRASRLTLLYGESGSGKSSALRAGVAYDLRNDSEYAIVVFPRIQKGEAVDSWRDDPVAGLTRAIHESLSSLLTRPLKPPFKPLPPESKPATVGNAVPPSSTGDVASFGAAPERNVVGSAIKALPGRRRAPQSRAADARVSISAEQVPAGIATSTDLPGLLEEYVDAVGRNLLIVLDQFEEYFQYHPDDAGPGTLAGELPRLVNRRDLPVNFLISIRQDALACLDRFKNQIPNLLTNYLRIEYLSPASAKAAILKPLGKHNEEVEIGRRTLDAIRGHLSAGEQVNPDWTLQAALPAPLDPALSEAVKQGRALFGDSTLLRDIPQVSLFMKDEVAEAVVQEIIQAQKEPTQDGGEPAGVPDDGKQEVQAAYLQLVMTRWWEKEVEARSTEMRRQTLTELGGVRRIVEEHLQKTLTGVKLLTPEAIARVFGQMVTSSGRKIALTVSELAGSDLSKTAVASVLEELLRARIVTAVPPPRGSAEGEKCYEFAHDVVAKAALKWVRVRRVEAAEREATKARRRSWALAGLVALAVASTYVAFRAYRRQAAQSKELKKTQTELRKKTGQIEGLVQTLTKLTNYGWAPQKVTSILETDKVNPTIRVLSDQSSQADAALKGLLPPPSSEGRDAVTVEYFPKDVDSQKVEAALRALGFKLASGATKVPDLPTNAIWFAPRVRVDDVKRVAYVLIRAGLQIRGICPFNNTAFPEPLIQVGASHLLQDRPPITVEALRNVRNAGDFPCHEQ
jgi:hypothetical protein